MKKYKNLVIASVLSATLINPALAAAKTNNATDNAEVQTISEESVKGELQNIKKTFNISNDYEFFNISRTPVDNITENKFLKDLTKKAYITNYDWSDEKLGSVNVSVNSDGDLVSYSKIYGKNLEDMPLENNVSKKDAEDAVLKVLNGVINNFDKKFVLTDYSIDRYTGEMVFSYNRSMNGVVFVDQVMNVTYSPKTNEIVFISTDSSYGNSISFVKDSNFKKDDKIGMDKAKETLLKESPLRLSYVVRGDKSHRVFYTEMPNINARTGEVEKNNRRNIYRPMSEAKDEAKQANDLSPAEKEKLQGIKNLAPQSEAKKVAKEIIGDDYKVKSFGTYTHNKMYTYDITLVKDEFQADVVLDAKNLDLISLSNFESSKNTKKLDEKELKKIAVELIREYTNTNDLNFKKMVVTMYDDYAEVFVPRYLYTRPVINDGIRVEINYDKNVNYFSKDFSNVEFDKRNVDMTPEEASDIYFASKDFGLKYQMTDEGPKLYYGSINSINPLIGKDKILRDISGEVINFKEQIKYEDLDKAKNKDVINYMTDAGIGIINKNLQDKVTYLEFVNLLDSYDSEASNSLGEAYGIKGLEKIKDKNIVEKDAVKAIVYYKNLNKFTEAKKIFKEDIFENQKDLKDYENYYIVAKGFDLIEDKIEPDKEMTLEEILYLINRTM
ncbi:YcdB/YcdC domain-containing protein [Peptoniphilus sp.]|jgi:hypothetical protein|uniref:YcdB/YcdC domain-containing protein n=1 Tax=Peptoniphilus sp. TaxID=1971214 RepID=UPI003D8C32F9